jgi:hypothetical protein
MFSEEPIIKTSKLILLISVWGFKGDLGMGLQRFFSEWKDSLLPLGFLLQTIRRSLMLLAAA